MTQISLETPEIGKPDKTEDQKIITCFTTVQTAINGNLDSTNLKPSSVTGESLDPSLTGRRLIAFQEGYLPAGATGLYTFAGPGEMKHFGETGAAAWGINMLNSEKYKVVGRSNTLIEIQGMVAVNSFTPATSYRFGIGKVNSLSGNTNLVVGTEASVLVSSTITPTAGQAVIAESATTGFPATGPYAFSVDVLGGAMAAGSFAAINVSLYALNT